MSIEPPSIIVTYYPGYTTFTNFDEVLPPSLQGFFKGMTLRASGDSSRYRREGFQGSSYAILYQRLMVLVVLSVCLTSLIYCEQASFSFLVGSRRPTVVIRL